MNNAYGSNRKIVLEIIRTEGKAMLKSAIVQKFEEITGLKDQNGVVTTAISSLNFSHVLIGYKPEGAKFRGLYWTLKTWWVNDKLAEEHKPAPYNPISKYL